MPSEIQADDSARWAADLTQDQLHTVLWLTGEFLGRGYEVHALVEENLRELDAEHECRRAFERLTALFDVSPNDATDLDPALPVISDRIREQFPTGKHTRWAIGLSDAKLHGILANIGSFAKEADLLFDFLCKYASKTRSRYVLFRASFALKSLVEIVRGERYTIDEYCGRMGRKKWSLVRWIKNEPPTGEFDLDIEK